MLVGRVTGNVVSTNKCDSLRGAKLLIVQPVDLETLQMKDDYVICVDDVGAGEGDLVFAPIRHHQKGCVRFQHLWHCGFHRYARRAHLRQGKGDRSMQLAKVIGSMVSTRKCERLQGLKLLVAVPIDMDTFEEKGAPFITVDTVGAGEGEIVMWAGGSSSRQTDLTTNKPVDSSIIGIVDFVDILGERKYRKGDER